MYVYIHIHMYAVSGTLNKLNFQIFKLSNICFFKLSNFYISKLPYFQNGFEYMRL